MICRQGRIRIAEHFLTHCRPIPKRPAQFRGVRVLAQCVESRLRCGGHLLEFVSLVVRSNLFQRRSRDGMGWIGRFRSHDEHRDSKYDQLAPIHCRKPQRAPAQNSTSMSDPPPHLPSRKPCG